MFTLRADIASYEEIENTIVSGAKLQGTNACVLMLAILVASVGLNTNSTAVIIGAMLISPLMGSIVAIGYGIATNNLTLARFSAFRLSVQVLISILTSFVYFSISPITTASSELLARTSPTVWDVIIATCGGFAGIIGQTRKEKSNVIPGVAIATALMPPLCTAGYGLARRNWKYFSGALYLFFINGFFICLTAVIVLKFLRVPQFKELTKKQLGKIHRTIGVIAVITMMPSVYFAYDMIRNSIESSNAENYVKNEFVFEGTQIVQKNINIDEDLISLSLIGKEITLAQQQELEDKLADYNLSGYHLSITQTTVRDGVTADEVKAMLAEYEDSDEGPDVDELLYFKENEELRAEIERLSEENGKLKTKVEEQSEKVVDVHKLCSELEAIEPKIKGAAAAYADIGANGTLDSDKLLITVLVSKKLDNNEYKRISSWLAARLENDDITVFQQELKEYLPEVSSKADTSSKTDESGEDGTDDSNESGADSDDSSAEDTDESSSE